MKRASVTPENAKKMAGTDLLDGILEEEGLPEAGLTREIPLDEDLARSRSAPQVYSEESLQELAASIKEVGILQPIMVSRHGKEGFTACNRGTALAGG